MNFGNPAALWALFLLPVAGGIGWLGVARGQTLIATLGTPSVVERLFPPTVARWRRRRVMGSLAVLLLLTIAAARPQYGRIEQTLHRRSVDIMIAIDTSPSMLVADVAPDRLTQAKDIVRRLSVSLRGNRVGIIAFAGDAFMLCPLTLDYSIANLIVDSIDATSVPIAGTDFGRVIDIASGAFEREGSANPALIIISDGEDNEGRGLIAAAQAARKNLRIYTIGVGTERGAPVPDGRGGYKELPDGSKVLSRLDSEGLAAIAAQGGGLARNSGDGMAASVDAIVKDIRGLDEARVEARKIVIYQDRFSWFVIPAAALLVWLLLTKPEQPARRPENRPKNRPARRPENSVA